MWDEVLCTLVLGYKCGVSHGPHSESSTGIVAEKSATGSNISRLPGADHVPTLPAEATLLCELGPSDPFLRGAGDPRRGVLPSLGGRLWCQAGGVVLKSQSLSVG